jgi:hypothetical protein
LSRGRRADTLRAMSNDAMRDGTSPGGGTPRTTLLVITGMHRSGTSALARSCNLLGVDLGDDFIPTQPDNRSGFWEDASVKDADDAALAAHGMLWDDVGPPPEPWHDGFGGEHVRERLRETLVALSARGALCGVKDPRISRLLPLWLPLLDPLDVVPVFLLALREPREVARSLARREGLGEARALLLWLRYTLEAERATRGRRRAIVCFDDLLEDWRGTLDRVARTAGIRWPVPYDAAAEPIGRFLDPTLKHHVAMDPPGEGLVRLACDAFVAARALRDGESAEHHAVLDRVRATLAAADVVFAPLLRDLEARAAHGSGAPSGGVACAGAPVGDVLRTGAPDGAEAGADAGGEARSPAARELDRARREAMLAHELVGQRDRELAAEIERAGRERDALAARIAAGEAANAAAAARIALLDHDVAVLRREADALREARDAALAVIAGIERSVSWRLTSPLRAVTSTLRGRRGA